MTILETIRDLLATATPGPWKADLDKFDADDIHACVTDEDIEFLATIATGCNFYQPKEYESYTPKMKADQDAAWAKAKESQALRDAELIAALRNAAPALLRVADAARACYEEDDFITEAREGDGRQERDQELGAALEALVRA